MRGCSSASPPGLRRAYFDARLPAARSRASRAAVRTFDAAADAFLARAKRSSGVIFLAEALPPCLPNLRDISVIAALTSGGIFMPMPQSYT
jgi:hypothetical protein